MPIIEFNQAVQLLKEGQQVAFPTETVYGLGADATNSLAVAGIYERKNRPSFNPLIAHVCSLESALKWAFFSKEAFKIAEHFWPGPLTLILPLKENVPLSSLVSAGLPTIALRVPSHPLALKLLKSVDLPIAAPSANRSGAISPTQSAHVLSSLGADVPVLEGDKASIGLESTILDLSGEVPTLLRPGGISFETLQDFFPSLQLGNGVDHLHGIVKAPGQLKSHYASRHPLRMNAKEVKKGEGLLAFGPNAPDAEISFNLSLKGDLKEAASNLFDMMHLLDQMDVIKKIAVMPIPLEGVGFAINDRLKRASFENDS